MDYRVPGRENPFRQVYDSKEYSNANVECPEYPLLLDIETTNKCNLKCVFCNRQLMTRSLGEMSVPLFKTIADKAANKVRGLRFSGWGEPFLNKGIYEMFAYAKEQGFLVHVTTNGLAKYFYPEKLEKVDSINFSMQGLNAPEYAKIRNNTRWNDLVNNIKKTVVCEVRPYVTLATTVTDEGKEEMDKFIAEWKDIVDRIQIGQTSFTEVRDILRERKILSDKDIQRQTCTGRKWKCNMPWIDLEIDWDGKANACCADFNNLLYVGNLSQSSMEEIWNGEKIKIIRKMIDEHREHEQTLCSHCAHRY